MSLTITDLNDWSWVSYSDLFAGVEILLMCGLFSLGYVAYINPAFFDVPATFQQAREDHMFAVYEDREELDRLQEMLLTRKLFTKTKLSLEELSQEMNLPARYVSYLINTYHQTNFHDFINGFRVREVIGKISDASQHHKTLLGLAMEAGFNSKSAFNHVFKIHTGKTPSAYLAAAKRSPETRLWRS